MKELSVHGGGAVFARISERFGLRLAALWMFRGIDTVNGFCDVYESVIAILTSSSSPSICDVVGDEAVDDDVLIDSDCPGFRDIITLLHSCLYTRRALVLPWSSMAVQEQKSVRNGCASLT